MCIGSGYLCDLAGHSRYQDTYVHWIRILMCTSSLLTLSGYLCALAGHSCYQDTYVH